MKSLRYYTDWWFKDLTKRRGGYVIGEPANPSIIIFTVSIILALISYKGFWQIAFSVIAYVALGYWGFREVTSGHSRFRKLLGVLALVALVGALIMHLGL